MKYFFFLTAFVFQFHVGPLAAQTDSLIDWKSDIEYLKTELPQKHKNLFFKYSREEFNSSLDALIAQTGDLSDLQVAIKLQQIITRIGDSHTSLDINNFLSKDKILSFGTVWFPDGIHIVLIEKENRSLLGGKLKSINGFPLQRIVDSLSTLFVVDNDACLKRFVPNFLFYSQILNYFGFMSDSTATLEVEDSGNRKIEGKLIAKTYYDSLVVDTGYVEKLFSKKPYSNYFSEQYYEEDSIYFVKYRRCWGKELEQRYGNKERADSLPAFIPFYQSVLKTLKEKPVKKMIFDMRANSGGSSLQAMDFIKQLGGMKELNKRNKLYVAIGRRTFSSAILNANDFKRSTKAVFIGEETSGKPNHYGSVNSFNLPSSDIEIIYSTWYFKRVSGDPKTLEPDIKCEITFEDFLNGVDPVYRWVKNNGR